MPDTAFDEGGRHYVNRNEKLYREDGSHPDEWKGHFVVVENSVAKVKNDDGTEDYVQYHESVVRHNFKSGAIRLTCGYKESFNPTVFKDYESAKAALEEFGNRILSDWSFVSRRSPDDIFLKRESGWFFRDGKMIDPYFEILDAFEYRTKSSSMVRGLKTRVGAKPVKKDAAPNNVRVRFDVDKWIAEQKKRDEEKRMKSNAIEAKLLGGENATYARYTSFAGTVPRIAKSDLRFFAKDAKTGKYLSIPPGCTFRESVLTNLDDATYFEDFDTILKVMNAIEHAFWNPEFQRWHLTVQTATIKNGVVSGLKDM